MPGQSCMKRDGKGDEERRQEVCGEKVEREKDEAKGPKGRQTLSNIVHNTVDNILYDGFPTQTHALG